MKLSGRFLTTTILLGLTGSVAQAAPALPAFLKKLIPNYRVGFVDDGYASVYATGVIKFDIMKEVWQPTPDGSYEHVPSLVCSRVVPVTVFDVRDDSVIPADRIVGEACESTLGSRPVSVNFWALANLAALAPLPGGAISDGDIMAAVAALYVNSASESDLQPSSWSIQASRTTNPISHVGIINPPVTSSCSSGTYCGPGEDCTPTPPECETNMEEYFSVIYELEATRIEP